MPSDSARVAAAAANSAGSKQMSIASVRILRLALGTALSMLFSQIVAWPMSFIAPVLTMFILALPLPALSLSNGIKFILVFVVAVYAGLAFLPFMLNQRTVGVLLLSLALFHSFYFTARGGSQVIGAFATVGLALVTSIGTVSTDAVLQVSGGLSIGAVCGVLFVWVAHAILPDSLARVEAMPAQSAKPQVEKPDLADARRNAFRSLAIVMPVILWFMLSSASASYAAFLIKVASMGQQADIDKSRHVAKSVTPGFNCHRRRCRDYCLAGAEHLAFTRYVYIDDRTGCPGHGTENIRRSGDAPRGRNMVVRLSDDDRGAGSGRARHPDRIGGRQRILVPS
jgi:hypothetical protein